MEATELRFGNLTNKGIVHGIRYNQGILGCDIVQNKFESFSKWFDYREIKPIPLTEEWLLKFGFYSKNKKIGWWENDKFSFIGRLSGCILHFHLIVNDMFVEIIRIQYVHQLQNLYFALTGTELKIE